MSFTRRLGFLAWVLVGGASLSFAQPSYSTAPLEAEPLLDQDAWARQGAQTFEWLGENYEKLAMAQWPQVREHLYLLIGRAAQGRYEETGLFEEGADLPPTPRLFAWASRFGAIGADLIAESLADSSLGIEPGLPPDSLFEVAFEAPFLRFGAPDRGWSVQVPYYFMTWQLARTPVEGHDTDILVTSTLHDRNRTNESTSQSTLMLVISEQDCAAFETLWAKQAGMTEPAEPSNLVEGGMLYRATVVNGIKAEALFWTHEATCAAVIYSGLPGPFEANYVHFGDFVRALDL
ncbi:MAG: hypothetical protein AAGG50_07365 [Bacteroidota bacterium]